VTMKPNVRRLGLAALLVGLSLALPFSSFGRQERRELIDPPDRRAGEGEGPFKTLVIRGAILIDGTGAPPQGPVDIVVEGNRIAAVRSAGTPGLPPRPNRPPEKPDHEIDATGMYVMPGFVDLHAHFRRLVSGAPAEYTLKLWLAHGITTAREAGSNDGVNFTLRVRERSARNEIAAPRIFAYARPGARGGWRGEVRDPDEAREFVRWAAGQGIDGLKLQGAYEPPVMAALIDEARRQRLGTTAHLDQTGVAQMNALDAARLGLHSLNHWYGLPEALIDARTIQDFPVDYNHQDEQHRFGEAGRLWEQAAAPGSDTWTRVMQELLDLRFVLVPTLTIYEASRDVMAARYADWHDRFTLPSVWETYQPSRVTHGSYWYYWTTADEVAWRRNYQRWLRFLNEYKNRGGRVCTGTDVGLIYKLYGFDFVRELELLQEAGFHPLEVIRAATSCGAAEILEPMGRPVEFGTVRAGQLADLVVVDQNPLENLKVLYGTGAVKLNDQTRRVERVGGVKWTIKDGIVYDAKKLLADVAAMVEREKRR